MRIIAGCWKGLRLAHVGKGDAAAALRPTSDRVRESLFNLLAHGAAGNPVGGAVVLDLFAGTGALGLEALSRGAAQATFVESGRVALGLLQGNIEKTGAEAKVIARDATRLGPSEEAATLVFLDPPYGKGLGTKALTAAQAGGWIAPGAVIVWEESAPMRPPPGFEPLDARVYGGTHVSIFRHAP